MSESGASPSLEHLLRDVAPQVLGALVRRAGDFGAAEDALQDAMLAAITQWPRDGVPDNPGGWLYRVARRRWSDARAGEQSRRARESAVGERAARAEAPRPDALDPDALAADDALALLFTCCHPALTTSSAIALTLRAVGGLTTAEIAGAFLVPETTMAQRISRAKESISESGLPFAQPNARERAERMSAVLHVLYLIFNEGYASSAGAQLVRLELGAEAIRLARLVHRLAPDDAEAAGLLALLLLTDARRAARTGNDGQLIPLDEQDRSRWDRAAIEEGVALVSAALARGAIGPYQLQAAIAALHDEAPSAEETDWPQILALYSVLARLSDNPMVALNHAVALAMVHGPRAGLERLDALAADPRLAQHHRLAAVRAHLLDRAGDREAAIAQYRAAAELTANLVERQYLLRKADHVDRSGS